MGGGNGLEGAPEYYEAGLVVQAVQAARLRCAALLYRLGLRLCDGSRHAWVGGTKSI